MWGSCPDYKLGVIIYVLHIKHSFISSVLIITNCMVAFLQLLLFHLTKKVHEKMKGGNNRAKCL